MMTFEEPIVDGKVLDKSNIGILAIQTYIPVYSVKQSELEIFDGVSEGKYTIGLGQESMGFCSDREDIQSICLTVLSQLLERHGIPASRIGRLEVGTETLVDKSKSVKSCLMQLLGPENTNVEGIDTTNACYGATSAIFNSVNWIESSSWDGRLAVVIAADIAVYEEGPARATGGAGAIAIVIGPNAPLVFEKGTRCSHMEHNYDFFKPNLDSEYPVVNGRDSIDCYQRSLDICYERYMGRLGEKDAGLKDIGFMIFHCPFSKLVQKAFSRIFLIDEQRRKAKPLTTNLSKDLQQEKDSSQDTSLPTHVDRTKLLCDKSMEKAFMQKSNSDFEAKVLPTLRLAKKLGNMYCASLLGGLVSLLTCQSVSDDDLYGKRICCYSYGSGSCASIFSLTVVESNLESLRLGLTTNLKEQMASRSHVCPDKFYQCLRMRAALGNRDCTPESDIDHLRPGTYYLDRITEQQHRIYLKRE